MTTLDTIRELMGEPPAPPPAAGDPPRSPTPPPKRPASPETLAWRAAYRIYGKYAPQIKAADSMEAIGEIFSRLTADADLRAMGTPEGDGDILLTGVYYMLEELTRRRKSDLLPASDADSGF